jgi:alcohol dehydrogenase
MNDFSAARAWRNPTTERVETGVGKVAALPKLLKRCGATRIVLATSNSVRTKTPNVDRVLATLTDLEVHVFADCRQHSPESDIVALARIVDDFRADAVVSIGGSSIFDTVKIACSRSANAEGVSPIPQIAIPTTLSAGEFTFGAGYTEEETRTKKLVLDQRAAPRYVILDPLVTLDTPMELWLSSGIKALDHALEAVWAIKPHPFADALALEAIRLFFTHLPRCRDQTDVEARAACQFAAWLAITAAGGAGMRLSHFLGHQIGARLHIPHGITSCILLPSVMRHLRPQTLDAQCRIAQAMGVDDEGIDAEELASRAADRLEAFIGELGLPNTVGQAGADSEDIEAITSASFDAARELGLAADLPEGAASIRRILTGS